MAISVNWNAQLEVTETLDTAEDNIVSAASQTYKIANMFGNMSDTSTVPASKKWTDNRTLAGTTETLDLTALTGPYGTSVSFNGKKVQGVLITASSSNVANIIVDIGATNPYHIFGDANSKVAITPGGVEFRYVPNNGQSVGSSNKNVKVSGTIGDSYNIIIVAG